MELNCVTDMDTENTTDIFEKKGINCSQDDSQRKYSSEFHPAYYPETNKCVGYHSLPQEVKCKASQDGHSENMRRICKCMNKGKACFELGDKYLCFVGQVGVIQDDHSIVTAQKNEDSQ